jgi:hypothetical protein
LRDPGTVLRDAVTQLTRPHHRYVRDEEGGGRVVPAAPLLVQLRMEITSASGGTGGGASSTTAAIPLAAAALDLFTEIAETVHEEWWLAHRYHHGHGRGKLVTELRWWTAVARRDPESLARAATLCAGWAAAITNLLQPVRRWEIVGACPTCGAERVVVSMEDGLISAPALCLEFDQCGATGLCRVCKDTFDPELLAVLLRKA